MKDKAYVRKQILDRRKNTPQVFFTAYDRAIEHYYDPILSVAQQALSYRTALYIGGYLAQPHEPSISGLLHRFLEITPHVYCPITTDQPELSWARYSRSTVMGRWNIPIPPPPYIPPSRAFDVIFIPALAINPHGYRLGHGAGYYDRSLSSCSHAHTILIGVCSEEEKLMAEHTLRWSADPWDIPVHYILTESTGLSAVTHSSPL